MSPPPTRLRRSRAFRPAASGLERLESLRLLDGAEILPDPVTDFDPDAVTYVDADTCTSHAESIGEPGSWPQPVVIAAQAAPSLADIRAALAAERDKLLATVNSRINLVKATRDNMKLVSDFIGKQNDVDAAARDALPDIPANAARRNSLQNDINTRMGPKGRLDLIIHNLTDELISLYKIKDQINQSYNRVYDLIRETTYVDPDTGTPVVVGYETDDEPIVYA